MNSESALTVDVKSLAVAHWKAMLRDDVALLAMPGAHHKALLGEANSLYLRLMIDVDDLSDLLELADAALAFAIESLLDIETGE